MQSERSKAEERARLPSVYCRFDCSEHLWGLTLGVVQIVCDQCGRVNSLCETCFRTSRVTCPCRGGAPGKGHVCIVIEMVKRPTAA
jgi:hypothetical protein